MSRLPIVIHWPPGTVHGWGVYGLNLAAAWSLDSEVEPVCSAAMEPSIASMDPLRRHALTQFFAASGDLRRRVETVQGNEIFLDVPVLVGLGNGFIGLGGKKLTGSPHVGVVFFEIPHLDSETLQRARQYELLVVGCAWAKQILAVYGFTNVHVVLQGVDPALFCPGPRSGLFRDRFTVFSGGKLELRKGQDLVLKAFRIFARRHPEALLVTAWHSPWPAFAQQFAGLEGLAPPTYCADGSPDMSGWAIANGISERQFVDLGAVPNPHMPAILREMDVAIFPNRAEGGTNLVAMECMACGVPVVLARNTGHIDLIEGEHCFVLERQQPLDGPLGRVGDIAAWCSSDVDEIVDVLERVRNDREEARRRAALALKTMARLTWQRTAKELKAVVLEARTRGA